MNVLTVKRRIMKTFDLHLDHDDRAYALIKIGNFSFFLAFFTCSWAFGLRSRSDFTVAICNPPSLLTGVTRSCTSHTNDRESGLRPQVFPLSTNCQATNQLTATPVTLLNAESIRRTPEYFRMEHLNDLILLDHDYRPILTTSKCLSQVE